MEFDLTDDQELLRETTRRFLERECPLARVRELADDPTGVDRSLWKAGAELGWCSLLVDADHGGGSVSGDGMVDAAIVAEELGALVHPGPLISANVVGLALTEHGSARQQAELLPGIVGGDMLVSWCVAGADDRWTMPSPAVKVESRGGELVLRGERSFVEFASAADCFLVVAEADAGLTQVLVPADTAGVTIAPLASLDLTRPLAVVQFDDVVVSRACVVGAIGGAAAVIEDELRVAVTLQCAETVGAVDRVFSDTLQYAKDRVAFGRPVGSYQAIKHRFADMAMWLEACKGTTSNAARRAREPGMRAGVAVSVAKAYVAEHAWTIASDCQQITGGIAMTWEHDLHLYLRRIVADASLFGSPSEHRERVCALMEAA